MPAVISRKTLTEAAWARLQTVTGATHFLGEASKIPMDGGYATPYTSLWPGVGDPDVEPPLADCATELAWDVAITCAAGFVTDVTGLVDRVTAAFYRWEPVVTGLVCGPFRPPEGYRPSLLLDRDATPHRPYALLQFRSTITAN